jgi:hypothetical protein
MRKLVVAGFAVAALFAASVGEAQATGCFHRSSCGGCAPAPSDCGYGGGYAAPCGPSVSYVPQMVTTYQAVWKEREQEVIVHKAVAREEKFEYNVCVPKTRVEKRKVTTYQNVTKEVEFKYTVSVAIPKSEKRVEKYFTPVSKQVEFTYFENVCTMVPTKQVVTRYTCVPKTVMVEVPVCTVVRVPCCDPCGNVSWTCQRVMTTQQVCRVINETVPVQQEVVVNVPSWAKVERKGVRTVCEYVPAEREVVVNFCTYEMQERIGKRLVCDVVAVVNEVDVQICFNEFEKRVGVRTVYDYVPEKQKVTVRYCETVAVQTQVMVPVYSGCADYGPAPYASYGGHQGFGGCFRNFGGCFGGHHRGCN